MTMPAVDLFEAIMRGGATALTLVMSVHLLSTRPFDISALFGALFLWGAALYAVITIPVIEAGLGPMLFVVKSFAIASPAFFWLFIIALLEDSFRWRNWMAVPPVLAAGLGLICAPFPQLETASRLIQFTMTLGLMTHVMICVRACATNDLVVSRWRFTRALAVLVPVIVAMIVMVEVIEILGLRETWGRHFITAGLVIVSATLALTLTGLRKTLIPERQKQSAAPVETLSAADRIALGRLRDLMDEGLYLSAGLTIGSLAGMLELPEHRLRKLINNGLGYRNFAAFLNDYRIEEAKRRLASAALVNRQITTLAFDVGFGSLAPFNRAFRDRTGMSPTEYREKMLLAD